MSTSYITEVEGSTVQVCHTASCALSRLHFSVSSCMVSIQGCSFHADHVPEEALRTELETAGELSFEYEDGTQITVSKITQQEQRTT